MIVYFRHTYGGLSDKRYAYIAFLFWYFDRSIARRKSQAVRLPCTSSRVIGLQSLDAELEAEATVLAVIGVLEA